MATESRAAAAVRALREALTRPVDSAGLVFARRAFGVVMLIGTLRFWARGWIDSLYVAPKLHFHYYGFEWVQPLPGWGMHAVFALIGLSALALAFAPATARTARIASLALFVAFTYAELCEKAAYLNHYYLASVVALLFALLPVRAGALAPAWASWALRLQVAAVYFFAGWAKLDADWLIDAQPLGAWLSARSDWPLVGTLLGRPGTAHVAAWTALAFDLSMPLLLVWRRSRAWAYAAALAFHAVTGLLFPIGMFPWIMAALGSVFFAPDWPRVVAQKLGRPSMAPAHAPPDRSRSVALAVAVLLAVQLALPLRAALYPGPSAWTDEGFRFAWRVMIADKVGEVAFDVWERDGRHRARVSPSEYLTPFQERMMVQSPDMILELGHRIADDQRRLCGTDVRVTADAWASLNGRPSQRLVHPTADLAQIDDGLLPASYIVPLEAAP